jgi:hypothetical protein
LLRNEPALASRGRSYWYWEWRFRL